MRRQLTGVYRTEKGASYTIESRVEEMIGDQKSKVESVLRDLRAVCEQDMHWTRMATMLEQYKTDRQDSFMKSLASSGGNEAPKDGALKRLDAAIDKAVKNLTGAASSAVDTAEVALVDERELTAPQPDDYMEEDFEEPGPLIDVTEIEHAAEIESPEEGELKAAESKQEAAR